MKSARLERHLAEEDDTTRLGEDIAAALRTGDVVALAGDLGAGKTTLARGLIRALCADPALEVPSPTFTLVQSYEAAPSVHHFDLYRVQSPFELEELGFEEMADTGIVLMEWPDRAGDRIGPGAIRVELVNEGEGRRATILGPDGTLARIERSLALRAFLADAGWADARRSHLAGDASTRAYERVELAGEARLVMNAPRQPDGPPIRDGLPYSRIAHLAESVTPFVAVGRALAEAGFAAPRIFAQDLDAGFLLLEHLGTQGMLDAEGRPVGARYVAGAQLLAAMHERTWPRDLAAGPGASHRLPDYDRGALAIETQLLTDWYVPAITGAPADAEFRAAFDAAWNRLFDRLDGAEKSIVLRDFHSPNLIWRGERSGTGRLGLIDFQDAVIGPAAYDVASLAMDARVDIEPELETAVVEAYCAARGGAFDRTAFEEAYAIMAAQRNSKILGIFVRLDRRDGKPGYLRHLPRIRDYLGRALAHPALSELRALYDKAGLLTEPA